MTPKEPAVTAEADLLRRSPLHDWADRFVAVSSSGQVTLAEVPFVSMVNLRVRPGSPDAQRVESGVGCALPGPMRAASATRGSVLWLGPDEWLLVDCLAPEAGSLVDVSANRTTIRLGGPWAREVLEKGVAIDLHPRATAVAERGQSWCAQTLLTSVPVILWHHGDVYDLLVRPSFAAYIADWLLDAATEYTAS
jgi:sarcosine oxidase subunit gamma